MHWYKRDGDAFIAGTIELTLEEIGAYTLVIDAIYGRNNKLTDDVHLICKLLRCDPRVWKRIRARLLACGKLHIEAGFLTNSRATYEVCMGLHRMDVASKLGQSSAQKRKQNNDRPPTAPLDTTTTTSTKKDFLSSSLTTSEQLQPSQELLEHERKRRPAPGSLATAPFDSALARPAYAAASTKAARDPSTRKFSRAEVGKPNGWDWNDAPKEAAELVSRETCMNEQPGGVINETPTAQSRATKH